MVSEDWGGVGKGKDYHVVITFQVCSHLMWT